MIQTELPPISEELKRILRPLNGVTRHEAPGMPMNMGRLPTLFNFAAWPDFGEFYACITLSFDHLPKGNYFKPKEMFSLSLSEIFHEILLKEFHHALLRHLPPELIKIASFETKEQVLKPGEGRLNNRPHIDFETGSFTAIAAFPATILYPTIPQWTYNQDHVVGLIPKNELLTKYRAEEVEAPLGSAVLWNDDRFLHRAAINDKTREEWLEYLKLHPGADKLVLPDGSIRSLMIRAIMEFDKNKIDQYCAQMPQPAVPAFA